MEVWIYNLCALDVLDKSPIVELKMHISGEEGGPIILWVSETLAVHVQQDSPNGSVCNPFAEIRRKSIRFRHNLSFD